MKPIKAVLVNSKNAEKIVKAFEKSGYFHIYWIPICPISGWKIKLCPICGMSEKLTGAEYKK